MDGAAQESNLPSRGLHDRTGFEDQLGHRAHAAPCRDRSHRRLAGRVHGVIFTSFRDYLTAEHGSGVAQAVFADQPIFLLSESYDDAVLLELVGKAATDTETEVDEVVYEFGRFTAQTTFARLYPAFFAIAPSAREFLLTVETRIHELVRATIPNAVPPQLRIEELGPDGVQIVYSSARHLCVLLRGLVQGTAGHYGEHAEISESTCMLRGDASCTFEITLSSRDLRLSTRTSPVRRVTPSASSRSSSS